MAGIYCKKLYYKEMGQLFRKKFTMLPALLFYGLYVVGVVLFVVTPALRGGSLAEATGHGALFGLVAYATYDLTSLAVIDGFSTKIALVDMLWGTTLTALVASVTFAVTTMLA